LGVSHCSIMDDCEDLYLGNIKEGTTICPGIGVGRVRVLDPETAVSRITAALLILFMTNFLI